MLTPQARFLAAVLFAAPAFCQQDYVSRYDAYVGYAYLNSPAIKMPEHGVQLQAGVRAKTWLSLGVDYTNVRGDLTLTPDLLPTELQQSLAATLQQLAALGRVPPGYQLSVKAHSTTQTFAAGPQVTFRHFPKVAIFVRPSIGLIREVAHPQPADAIARMIVSGLAPSGKKKDWAMFFGAGGGIDIETSRHVALRIQADYVYDHLFPDILRDGRRTVRFSVGPAFNFGRNVAD